MLTASVVIPAYHRPEEIRDCIRSILAQTRKPEELIVVDDGDLGGFPLEPECTQAGIRCIYHKKDEPGLTVSRNVAIDLASGDVIFYFDEDVVLEPGYLEAVMHEYEVDEDGTLGGASGVLTNMRPYGRADHLRRLLEMLFLVTGRTEGRVLPSGFCVSFRETGVPITQRMEVQFLPGCAMSYRRSLLTERGFDSTRYNAYGGEDKECSYRISRTHRLVVTPRARLEHRESPRMRPDERLRGRALVHGRYMFFREYLAGRRWRWCFFWYAVTGTLLIDAIAAIVTGGKKPKVAHLKGCADGVLNILAGRVDKVE